jgi:hypothetical protein
MAGTQSSPKQLMSTLSNLLSDFFRTPERGVFWDHERRINVDPLENLQNGFWDAEWDIKACHTFLDQSLSTTADIAFLQLKILRQLVEYQLTHSSQIRDLLDRAWGVRALQHKKKEPESAPPASDDPYSQKSLLHEPLGQDISRRRYWVVDGGQITLHATLHAYYFQILLGCIFQQTPGKSRNPLLV